MLTNLCSWLENKQVFKTTLHFTASDFHCFQNWWTHSLCVLPLSDRTLTSLWVHNGECARWKMICSIGRWCGKNLMWQAFLSIFCMKSFQLDSNDQKKKLWMWIDTSAVFDTMINWREWLSLRAIFIVFNFLEIALVWVEKFWQNFRRKIYLEISLTEVDIHFLWTRRQKHLH